MLPCQRTGPHRRVHRRGNQQGFRVPVPGADNGGEEVVAEALLLLRFFRGGDFFLFFFFFLRVSFLFRGRRRKNGFERGEKSALSFSLSLSSLNLPLQLYHTHVCELRQAIGRRRCDDADVGPPPQLDVQDGVTDAPPRPPLVLVPSHGPRRRRQVFFAEEAAGRVGGDDADVTELGEEAGELCVCGGGGGGAKSLKKK